MKLSVWYLIIITCFIFANNVSSQNLQRCNTSEYVKNQLTQYPSLKNDLLAEEAKIENVSKSTANKKTAFTIPIVVHIVYNKDRQGDNISNAQIISQIEVLNEDYQRKNVDIDKVPNRFKDLVANMDIEFCLANRDENGNFTDGITRTETTINEFTTDDNQIKRPELGGVKAWNRDLFLNIWVGRLEDEVLGYATPPGFPQSIDGVVIGTRYFGKGGQYNLHLAYNQGRTTTHEIGHWLSLKHPWGIEEGCDYDDGIEDTPTSNKPYYDCPSESSSRSCGSQDMTMNFMEYVNDNCMHMFTLDQKERITQVLNTSRASVASGERCLSVSNGLDAGIGVPSVEALYCEKGAFPIIVTVANLGSVDINSIRIQYTVNNGSVFDFNKTIDIPVGGVEEINLSNLNLSGINVIDLDLIEVNGGLDGVIENNFILMEVTIPEFGEQPLIENFKSENFDQEGWIIDNPDNDDFEWLRSNEYGAPPSGRGCLVYNNFSGSDTLNPRNTLDHLITPNFDFTKNTSISFSFDRAYAPYNEELFDALWIAYSIDCGQTWSEFWKGEGNSLATHPNNVDNGDPFLPVASDWKTETIDLTGDLSGEPSVQFRITNISGWGQLLWLDNVRIDGIVGINTFELTEQFTLAPNPSANGQFMLSSLKADAKNYQLNVFDVTGKQIFNDQLSNNQSQYQLNLQNEPNGMYMLRLSNEDKIYVSRIIISNH